MWSFLTSNVFFYSLSTAQEELTWLRGTEPISSFDFLTALRGKPDDASDRPSSVAGSEIVDYAGVWEEVRSSDTMASQLGVSIRSSSPKAHRWSDMLRFIESGQPDSVLRYLDRRSPVQEFSVAGDRCLSSGTCPPAFDVSVWFTQRELRGQTTKLGKPEKYETPETGLHEYITNLVQAGGTTGLIQSSRNPKNGQRHEHLRVIFPSPSGGPPMMLYRWASFKSGRRSIELVRWYRRSSMPSYPGRRSNPLPSRFTTNQNVLRRSLPNTTLDMTSTWTPTVEPVAPSEMTSTSFPSLNPFTTPIPSTPQQTSTLAPNDDASPTKTTIDPFVTPTPSISNDLKVPEGQSTGQESTNHINSHPLFDPFQIASNATEAKAKDEDIDESVSDASISNAKPQADPVPEHDHQHQPVNTLTSSFFGDTKEPIDHLITIEPNTNMTENPEDGGFGTLDTLDISDEDGMVEGDDDNENQDPSYMESERPLAGLSSALLPESIVVDDDEIREEEDCECSEDVDDQDYVFTGNDLSFSRPTEELLYHLDDQGQTDESNAIVKDELLVEHENPNAYAMNVSSGVSTRRLPTPFFRRSGSAGVLPRSRLRNRLHRQGPVPKWDSLGYATTSTGGVYPDYNNNNNWGADQGYPDYAPYNQASHGGHHHHSS